MLTSGSRARQPESERVDGAVAEPHLEVKVRPGAPARATRRADPLTLPDALAQAHAPAGEVSVEAREAAAVGDLDHVAVALVAAGAADRNHFPGLGRANGERAEGPDVDSRMARAERRRHRSQGRPRRPVRPRSGSRNTGVRKRQ